MPIRPENVGRYPRDWKQIVERVREHSGDRCEGSPAFPDCRRPNGWLLNKTTGELTQDGWVAETWAFADGDRVTRVILTAAHLDHTPEHNAMENLRHWCQRCHLNHDREHHAQTRYATRHARANTHELFETA